MKKYITIGIAAILFTACNSHETELRKSNHERDSLMEIVNQRDSSINEFLSSFNDVERNLDSVAKKQHVITMNTDKSGEIKSTVKDRINAEIASINDLMDKNRAKLAELNRKLKSSTNKSAQFQKMIETLNDQIAQKDVELAGLNEKLNTLNAQVAVLKTTQDTLIAQNTSQSQTISQQTIALHTAYYVAGTSKDLQNSKIINKTGGLLGIGTTSNLAGNFDTTKFTKIDYTQVTSIPINSNGSIKVITSHPGESYRYERDGDKVKSITILDPDKFWRASKYLVVIKD